MCDWHVHDGWVLNTHVAGMGKRGKLWDRELALTKYLAIHSPSLRGEFAEPFPITSGKKCRILKSVLRKRHYTLGKFQNGALHGIFLAYLKTTFKNLEYSLESQNWSVVKVQCQENNTHLTRRRILLSVGYASLRARVSELFSFLSSPIINTNAYEWKCLRFWYLIADIAHVQVQLWSRRSLTVILSNAKKNKTQLLFHAEEATNAWKYVQLPIPINSTQIQVVTSLLRSLCSRLETR